jgi:DNA-binding transcriptional ArsR family regulator
MGSATRCVTTACGAVGGVTTDKDRIEKVLAALADPTRRRLLDVLAAQGQATATMLATKVTVSRQAVVKHLKVLHEAGLVSCGRIGREMRYTVRPQQLDATARWMASLAAKWDRRLESVKRIAEMNDGSD